MEDDRVRLSEELKRAFARAVSPPAPPPPREVPMSFAAALAASIVAGRKTETRRPIRPQPIDAARATPIVGVGDRIWVREPWTRVDGGFAYQRDGVRPRGMVRWTAASFMPRPAARTFLVVIGVEAQRLSAIDEAAARAEGFDAAPLGNGTARDAFLATWDSFYGDGEFRAANDPWVWAIRFRAE